MIFKLTGQILQAFQAQSGISQNSGNQWMSQEFLLQHDFDQQHPKYMSFRVFGQQKIAQLKASLTPAEAAEVETVQVAVEAEEMAGQPAAEAEQPAAPGPRCCPQCGAQVAEDALFCNKCGAQL